MLLTIFPFFNVHQPLKISVLDVGQGDAILIQTPDYHNILVDAGPDSVVVDQLGKQMSFFDKTIDVFILTHPHRDHHAGILDVMQKYKIKKILLTGVASGDPLYLDFLKKAGNQSELIFVNNEQDLQISATVYLDVLYPFANQSLVGQEVHNKNNTSVVARLVRRTEDGWQPLIMLTGDAEMEEEREILLAGQDVRTEVLKLGHHGSRTSTSDVFLAAVDPNVAVISAGKDNQFEHPHPETMEKISDLEIRQTMEEGTIEMVW